MHATLGLLDSSFPPLYRGPLTTLQVNLGYLCNQSCVHCHVNAGPTRTEQMTAETVDLVLEYARSAEVATLDLTGGAPELNPHYRWLVEQCKALGCHVMTRCNLTVIETRKHRDLPEFFASHEVEVVGSLPH